jgi:catechol 2,3-dioxygenase-like lactoylglutathione lyase family enzyme
MRIRHLAVVVSDIETTASLYEDVLGFTRLGSRQPGNFPGTALDLTDGEVSLSLLRAEEGVPQVEWSHGTLGPNHFGIVVDDVRGTWDKLHQRGFTTFGERYNPAGSDSLSYFKFRDPDGAEVDVSETTWRLS